MPMDAPILIILAAIAAGLCFYAFRIAKEDERFAVTVMGRFEKLIGPGVLLKFPGSSSEWTRLRLGDLGAYSGDGIARFGDTAIPVKFEDTPTSGVQIQKFDENSVWVKPSNVLSVRCEKCGHHNQVAV